MKKIKKYIEEICEETEGAMCYAERYIEYKTANPQWSRWYGEMAEQELSHAEHLRSIGQTVIDGLAYVPEECMEDWERCLGKSTEKAAMVRLLLTK